MKEELIKKYMNNELCIKRNGASDKECENIRVVLYSRYDCYGEFEWLDNYDNASQPKGMQVITVQDFLKACEETDKEEDYSHLIGKEVEVRDFDNNMWQRKTLLGSLRMLNGIKVYFVDHEGYDYLGFLQMREKQETIHIEKGDYTKEQLEAELNKFKNK